MAQEHAKNIIFIGDTLLKLLYSTVLLKKQNKYFLTYILSLGQIKKE